MSWNNKEEIETTCSTQGTTMKIMTIYSLLCQRYVCRPADRGQLGSSGFSNVSQPRFVRACVRAYGCVKYRACQVHLLRKIVSALRGFAR
jgi:hypothetical protein